MTHCVPERGAFLYAQTAPRSRCKRKERLVTRAKAKVNTTTAVILAILGVVFIALGLFILMRQRHSRSLRKRFGPEYKHAVRNYGDKRKRRQNSLRARSASADSTFVRSQMKSKTAFLMPGGKPGRVSWMNHRRQSAKPTGWFQTRGTMGLSG